MTESKPIVFYDIASGPPVRTYAPNPWKTRQAFFEYALNFKGAHYETKWVELLDVASTRKELGVPANRTLPNGGPFYTLPIIKNLATGEIVGDSFEIALYLDKIYPDAATLVPPSTVGLHAAFNAQVDAIFSQHAMMYAHGIPMNPATAKETRQSFADRFGVESFDSFAVEGEDRVKALAAFEVSLGELAKVYKHKGGPFLEGANPTYADIIVGGWLQMLKATLPEWKDVQTWHNGLWGKIHQALEPFAIVK